MRAVASGERAVLERIPLGVLVYRGDRVLFANPALLDWTGRRSAEEIERAGGIAALFGGDDLAGADSGGKALTIRGGSDAAVPVEARLFSAPWHGDSAMVLVLRRIDNQADERIRMLEMALRTAEASARELHAILDTATDGVVIIDRDGRILGVNRAAEALFGYDGHELAGRSFGLLFAPESQRAAFDYIDGLLRGGVASVLNDGREVIGRVPRGRADPAVHDHGPHRRGRRQVLRGVPRHHPVEAGRGRAGGGAPGGRARPTRTSRTSWPRSATRSARRSMPSSASPK